MNLGLFRLDWRFVRSLGELHILTRASYVMLGIVPILAGVWSKLPWWGNNSHPPPLAHSWVYAFLAALAVTLGQVIYQLRAPEVVRRLTLDQYVRDETQHYSQQPTPARLQAADAILDAKKPPLSYMPVSEIEYYYPQIIEIRSLFDSLESVIKNSRLLADIDFPDGGYEGFLEYLAGRANEGFRWQFSKVAEEVNRVTSSDAGDYIRRELFYVINQAYDFTMSTKEGAIISAILKLAFPDINERGLLHGITKVGYAARLSYLVWADLRKFAMLSASILYTAAIVLIGIITVDQTIAVLKAAGWL